MNAITTINTPLFKIADTAISMVDGLYSLNDVHKASGGETKHKPAFFLRNEQTQEVITELQKCNSPENVLKVVRGGSAENQGTWACRELVYSYAMWISAKFHLFVVRAFDYLISRSDSQQREVLIRACERLSVGRMSRPQAYALVANQFGYEKPIDIPTPLLLEATEFAYEMILRLKPTQSSEPTTPQETNEVKMFWKCVGLTQYHETGKHLDQLLKTLHKAEDQLRQVNKSRSLIYDALAEPKHPVGGQEKVTEINQKALAFIQRQNAMKC